MDWIGIVTVKEIAMHKINSLISLCPHLFGTRETDREYAEIIFGLNKTAKSQFSQLKKFGRFEESVVERINKALSLTWYDEEFVDKEEPDFNTEGPDFNMVIETIEKHETDRCNEFTSTFVNIASAITSICTDEAHSEKSKNMLIILWAGQFMLLNRATKIGFVTMKTISKPLKDAAKQTLEMYPSLSQYVQTTQIAALDKMGPTWREVIEPVDGMKSDNLIEKRREVLSVYEHLSGKEIDEEVKLRFCGCERRMPKQKFGKER